MQFVKELLMSSRGHFLLIRVSIYKNVCIHELISKMVPAIFSFHFQGQRSKVTALEYMGPLNMSLFLVVFL